MITVRGDHEGTAIVMLGLARENIEKLMQGLPADVPLDRVGLPGIRVVLLYGETEQKIVRIFEQAGMVRPGTASDMPAMKDPSEQFHFHTEEDGGDGEWKKV